MTRIIIVGGVTAGMSAAHQARHFSPDASITVFESSNCVSGPCVVPFCLTDPHSTMADITSLHPQNVAQTLNAEIFLSHLVKEIDPIRKTVRAENRQNKSMLQFSYDKLVLTTGSVPVLPEINGLEHSSVFQIKNLDDGDRLKRHLAEHPPKKAIILGSDYISLEIAETLCRQDIAVTIFEPSHQILPTWHPEISTIVQQKLEKKSIQLKTNTYVQAIEPINASEKFSIRLVTNKGSEEADLCIVALGVKPNVWLAHNAGIQLGDTGAIAVNEKMETSLPDIYAAGECTEVFHLILEKNVYLPFGDTSSKQGRVAGANAAGGRETFPGVVGSSGFQVFDLQVARTGILDELTPANKLSPVIAVSQHNSVAYGYPNSKVITTVMAADKSSGRLLGAQMAGAATVGKRVDVLAACLYGKLTVEEIEKLDLVYAPPLSPLYDPVLLAARTVRRKIQDV